VIFTQFVDEDLGCASYLVGDETVGEAVVVDPALAVEQYLGAAQRHEVRIVRALETHTHADHVSGHGRLALEHGVPVAIHRAAAAEYPHESLEDGEQIRVGDVVLRTIHTPGHRPEHCAFAVVDTRRAPEPWLVLTGDSLFVGDVARPDLAVRAHDGAEGLFHSLRRLAELPDGVEVFPGHVAGSLCGAAMSSKPSTTIGFERRFNASFALGDLDEFVADSASTLPPRPPNVERIVALNRGAFVAAPPDAPRLDAVPADACLLDVRDADAFAAAHVHGALNVPVHGSSFATKAGFVLPPDARVAIHAESDDDAHRAARGLNAVGFLDLVGYVVGVPADESTSSVGLEELERLLAGGAPVLDVREKDERDRGYIPGTTHVPYRLVRHAAEEGLVDGGPVVTICETGARAAIAASVLQAAGVDARPVLHGGVATWRARGGETVEFRRCGA
jgi:glyoxylase-like metal-dependent hydrolase (beta-lactamase superfamily II)/rhodanese-related sulfurtransferase